VAARHPVLTHISPAYLLRITFENF
jgi:hypothetical protein